MLPLPKLYAIVDRETLDRRGIAVRAFALELREAGVRLLQYRDKGSGPQEVLRACEAIAEVFAGADATLILNDRADLALLAGWGVHVGQGDLGVAEVTKVLGFAGSRFSAAMGDRKARSTSPDEVDRGARYEGRGTMGVVGISTHTEEQVMEANRSDADYIAVGPVFATTTKLDVEAVVGLEGVRRARGLTAKPLVAIGGITAENAVSVIEAGADCVAMIGALMPQNGWSTMERVKALLETLGA